MALRIQSGIMLAIGLIIISVVFPIALALISGAGSNLVPTPYNYTGNNASTAPLSDVVDPTILTLFTYLLPIMAVVIIIMAFIPRGS